MKEINENELGNVVGGADSSKSIPDTYTVVAGDNLSSIAKRFNTTWQKLYQLNKEKKRINAWSTECMWRKSRGWTMRPGDC